MEVYFNERHGEIFGRTAEILGKLGKYIHATNYKSRQLNSWGSH